MLRFDSNIKRNMCVMLSNRGLSKKEELSFANLSWIDKDIFYDDELCEKKIFIQLFDSIPNKKVVKTRINTKDTLLYIKEELGIDINSDRSVCYDIIKPDQEETDSENEEFYYPHSSKPRCILLIKKHLILSISESQFEFLYTSEIKESEIFDLKKEILNYSIPDEPVKSRFYMIAKDYDGFQLKKFKVKDINVDIDLHYNDNFKTFHTNVVEFLNDDNRNGLVLMHGLSGTGKTSYIRHLIGSIKKKFIFLPLYMAESLSSPDLLPFLSEHKNCVLIIEDSEKLIKSRESGNVRNEISTLLNVSDGLLADALRIKLICTFNTGLSSIDKALLRKGRMVNRYEFKELAIDKAKKIAKKHNLNYKGEAPVVLGDLFNANTENYSDEIEEKRIGFR